MMPEAEAATQEPYKHTSSKSGVTYYLHCQPVKVPGKGNEGKVGKLYYFAKKVNLEAVCRELPDDRVVAEGANGFPIARKKK